MNPGLTTINQVVNDTLMPWLGLFEERKKLRKLLVVLKENSGKGDRGFFKVLQEAGQDLNYMFKEELYDDWERLGKTEANIGGNSLFIAGSSIVWEEPSGSFYFLLLINSCFSHLKWLQEVIETEKQRDYRVNAVMRSIKDISQLIIDTGLKKSGDRASDEIMEMVGIILSYMWISIYNRYSVFIEASGLALMKEDVYKVLSEGSGNKGIEALRLKVKEMQVLKEGREGRGEKPLRKAVNDSIKSDELLMMIKNLKKGSGIIQEGINEISRPEKEEKKYLRARDAVKVLGINRTSLNEWRRKGKIKDYRKTGNRFEYSENELLKLKNAK
jgi:hypothetical protein